jgi:hypothetical protein
MYINGQQQTSLLNNNHTLTAANHGIFSTATNLVIGARRQSASSPQDFYRGLIDEFAIFNTFLGQDNVSSIYNSGSAIDLRSNKNSYTKSANLNAYYKMGDDMSTVDRKNGLVRDLANLSLGSNLITNGDFSNGTNNWSFSGGAILENGAARINTASGGLAVIQTSAAVATIGKVYELKYDVVAIGSSNTATHLLVEGSSSFRHGINTEIGSSSNIQLPTTAVGNNKVVYFVFTRSDNKLVIKRNGSFGNNTDITLDNISLKEFNVNQGLTAGFNVFSLDSVINK